MRRFVISLSLCSAVLCAVPAAAQPSPRRGTVFIGANGFASIEKAPSTKGLGNDDDTSGTVAGGSLVLGVHLTPAISARFEWGLTDTLTHEQRIGINPLAFQSDLLNRIGIGGTLPSIIDQRTRIARKSTTGLALLGYHLEAGRASIELLGGLGLVNQDVRTSFDVRILSGLLPFPQPEYTVSNYHAMAVVGSDVSVALTDHLAVVPSVRAFALNGGLSVRPGVGLRWTF
jgi:hypothetical protein